MKESRDSRLQGYRKGRIWDWRDTGKRGIQDWRDTGKEGFRTLGIQEKRDAGKKGFRTGGIQEKSDLGMYVMSSVSRPMSYIYCLTSPVLCIT